MAKLKAHKIPLKEPDRVHELFGIHDEHLKQLEAVFGVKIALADGTVDVIGDPERSAVVEKLLKALQAVLSEGYQLRPHDLQILARAYQEDPQADLKALFAWRIQVGGKRQFVVPKGAAQRAYVEAMRSHDLVVGIGPAGTGKTYLAMALAVAGLLEKAFTRIILTRPAVEAGEHLGFLPGDIHEKIHPYLRPLYDALYEMMDPERVNRLVERGIIEVAPLAYMRGRTLNDSFIIMDEAQNSTAEQMKMFLTRLGFGSKAVITGDITQVDLAEDKHSGLIQIRSVLEDAPGIRFVYFTEKDVVRHPLVQTIIKAYERHKKEEEASKG